MIPAKLGWGSRCPRRHNPELTMTKVATKKSKPPASRAADFSADAESGLERNRQRTMIAENSSMALSPPNPRRAGLLAVQEAKKHPTATGLTQQICTVAHRETARMNSRSCTT